MTETCAVSNKILRVFFLLLDCCLFYKSNVRGRPDSVFTNVLLNVEIEQIFDIPFLFFFLFFFVFMQYIFGSNNSPDLWIHHKDCIVLSPLCALLHNISCLSWVVHGFFDHISVYITKNVIRLTLSSYSLET
jgi:hypothetical protein